MITDLIKTEDGSHTLYLPDKNEHYHSYHGAITESKHVFIQNGLEYYLANTSTNSLTVFEIGMGTGLNVFLTYLKLLELTRLQINYFAIEPFPLQEIVWSLLNYPEFLNAENRKNIFHSIHTEKFDTPIYLSDRFTFLKQQKTLQQLESTTTVYIVFFDAFAPRVQPELWTKEIFQKIYNLLKPGGILVTYCAKGEVKRNLKSVGFKVESLAGPPGKREMIRAAKLI
ncbi:MAG: tRNA (5-methylaminomethyl-2-thiouridine)(34)-methyltransferase MnmD [Bacteroidia bacterium]|nr:tRNA (5-methylaminomethyl-2-thiouridine)(34)-methyltransferase MnmD [Bacteroidia bacterium]